jgi:hypothetical protein
MKWTHGGQARREPVGPKWGRPSKLRKQFRGAGIDTGIVLYRYPMHHTRTERMGIDTGLIMYRYRVPYNQLFDFVTDFDFGKGYKYPVLGPK